MSRVFLDPEGKAAEAPFKTRPHPSIAGVRLGVGKFYDWYQCCGCGEFVHDKQDAGRWTQGGVWCALCSQSGRGAGQGGQPAAIESKAPPAYADATFETLMPTKLRKFLSGWPEKRPFVVLVGIQGSGKTRATWALEKRACKAGCRTRVEDCQTLRGRWLSGGIDNRERINEGLATCRWLILDGFSDAGATEGWNEAMQTLLSRRWSFQLATLITVMHARAELQHLLGSAVFSRLAQYEWDVLPDRDWRAAR